MSRRVPQPVLLHQQQQQQQIQLSSPCEEESSDAVAFLDSIDSEPCRFASLEVRPRASGEMPGYYQFSGHMDQRDVVWPRLQVLKEQYLHDMEQLYGLMIGVDSRALKAEHVLKFNHYKEVVRRMITYLRVTRERLPLEFKQNLLESFAQQIVMIMEVFKRKSDTLNLTSAPPSLPGEDSKN